VTQKQGCLQFPKNQYKYYVVIYRLGSLRKKNENNTFIQLGHIKLIKNDSKGFYNVHFIQNINFTVSQKNLI